ncbi:MAG TPA: hypothetical protein VK673_04675 [Chthoniobacterales bacterium]|nr:hypothetical protein [Chthoniobacterales bacterium]
MSEMLARLVRYINYVIDNLLELFQVVVSECAGTVLLAHGVHTEEVVRWIDANKERPPASMGIDRPRAIDNCKLCGDWQILSYWDIDVGGLACKECASFLVEAEDLLVANEFEPPSYILIVENP